MKRVIITVISLTLLLPFIYGGCGGDSTSVPAPPDLAGTFAGPGMVAQVANDTSMISRTAIAPPFDQCASFPPYIDISVTVDSEGNVEDALICGSSISAVLGTFTGTVTRDEKNILLYSFTGTATGSTLYTGGLVYDNTATYGVFFIHLNGEDFIDGVVERDATSFGNYLATEMVGSWSGFGFEFNDSDTTGEAPWRFEPMNLTATGPISPFTLGFEVSWTDSDDYDFASDPTSPTSPYPIALNTMYFGRYAGSFAANGDGYEIFGFQSPDRKFFGGVVRYTFVLSPRLWAVIALTKD